MKKKVFIVIFILIIVAIYFIYKAISFNMYYKNNHDDVIREDSISINKKDYKDYMEYNSIRINNIFKKYIFEEGSYLLFDKDEEVIEMFYEYEGDTYIESFINGLNIYPEEDKKEILSRKQRKDIIKDNNITKDIDLIKFMYDYLKKDLNILSSTNELKTYAYINNYLSNVIPLISGYREINGDYEGIIIYENNLDYENNYLINLYHDNRRYILSFIGNELSEEDIIDLIGTVRFNEKKE